jgi:hypothetical protein
MNRNDVPVLMLLCQTIDHGLEQSGIDDDGLRESLSQLKNEFIASRSKLILSSQSVSPEIQGVANRMCEFLAVPDTRQPGQQSSGPEVKRLLLNEFDRPSVEKVFEVMDSIIEYHKNHTEGGFITTFKNIFSH